MKSVNLQNLHVVIGLNLLQYMADGELIRLERREKTGADPMNSQDTSDAIEFINHYWKEIVEKWVECFVYRRAVKNTKINKRIRKSKED